MPKQIFQVKDFSGGLNTLQSGVDINDNQVRQAKNIMFNIRGILQSAYTMSDTTQVAPNGNGNLLTRSIYSNTNIVSTAGGESVQAGYGLGFFEVDYIRDGVSVSVSTPDQTGGSEDGFKFASSTTANTLSCKIDGDDVNLAASFPIGSKILITAPAFPIDGIDPPGQGVYNVVAIKNTNNLELDRNIQITIETPPEVFWAATVQGFTIGDEVILIANPKEHKIDTFSSGSSTKWNSDTIVLRSAETGTYSKVKYYAVDQAIRCCDTADSSDSQIQWYGYINRRHFDDCDVATDNNSYLGYESKTNDLAPPTENDLTTNATASPSAFTTYPAGAGNGFELNIITHTDVDGLIPQGVYECASTFIYDSNQESLPLLYTNTHTIIEANDLKALSLNVTAKGPYDSRISGGRIYIRDQSKDEEWIMLIDISLGKGCRTKLSDTYTPWHDASAGTDNTYNCPTATASDNFEVKELSLLTYELINGYPSSIFSNAIGDQGEFWKDSVIANNRAFICNVTVKNDQAGVDKSSTSPEHYGDRIMYSMPNRFDTFPSHNYIEAAKGEFDDYVAIDSFADRLIAFKKHSVDIINIAGDDKNWFLEDSKKYQGVLHPEALKKTQYGLVWVNTQGLFLYSGQDIKNLSEDLISDSDWSSHIGSNTIIIYDEQESMVFVVKDAASDASTYMCDLKTNTFTYLDTFVPVSDDGITNSVDTESNNTLIAHDEGDTIDFYQLYRTQATIAQVEFKTKFYDFGNPDIIKKIYAVYITYKCTDHALTNKFTLVQPDSTSTALAGTIATAANFTTIKVAPSSPVSCSRISLVFDSTTDDPTLQISDIGFEYRLIHKKVA